MFLVFKNALKRINTDLWCSIRERIVLYSRIILMNRSNRFTKPDYTKLLVHSGWISLNGLETHRLIEPNLLTSSILKANEIWLVIVWQKMAVFHYLLSCCPRTRQHALPWIVFTRSSLPLDSRFNSRFVDKTSSILHFKLKSKQHGRDREEVLGSVRQTFVRGPPEFFVSQR